MCKIAQYRTIMSFMERGPWTSEKSLMSECLSSFPTRVVDLTIDDADVVIDYCSQIMQPNAEGNCVDLWENEIEGEEEKEYKTMSIDLDDAIWSESEVINFSDVEESLKFSLPPEIQKSLMAEMTEKITTEFIKNDTETIIEIKPGGAEIWHKIDKLTSE